MSPLIITDKEIEVNPQRREPAKSFIQLHMRTDFCKPSDTEVNSFLNLIDRTNTLEYDCLDSKIMVTPSVLSTCAKVEAVDIVVDDLLEWFALRVDPDNKICSSINECVVPLYECLFTRIRLRLPFFNFEVSFLKHLKVTPS